MKRVGPRPLWLHLNGGAAMIAAASSSDLMFTSAQKMLQRAMDGVQHYHASAVKSFHRDMQIVDDEKGTRLLTSNTWTGEKHVLLIPSLINGWEIFDIEETHSFADYLASHGFKPLIVEWAEPDNNVSIETYLKEHLAPLLHRHADIINAMIGYCMGATFIAALYSAFADMVTSIDKTVLIAPPWDFSYQTSDQALRLQSLAMQTHVMDDIVPIDFVQSLFWAVDPLQVFKKFQKFPNVKNADRFVRVEDWLNAGKSVSKSVIQTCLFDWYRDNKVMLGEWLVDGYNVFDESLPEQTLIIAGKNDTLVPLKSIAPLAKGRQMIKVDTGHIGLMASDKSIDTAWKPIVEFLQK